VGHQNTLFVIKMLKSWNISVEVNFSVRTCASTDCVKELKIKYKNMAAVRDGKLQGMILEGEMKVTG
jgi:hypothetical protein